MLQILQLAWPYLLGTLHLAVMLIASAHVVLTKRDVRSAIGWVGVIWLTPLVGALLYALLGVNRIQRRARDLRRGQGLIDSSPHIGPVSDDTLLTVLGDDVHLRALPLYMGRLTRRPLLDGNKVTVYRTGKAAYDQMLAEIESAKRSIALETYIFDNDDCGRRFVAALERAHKRGVEVRVLIDSVGMRYTWPSIVGFLRKAGLKHAAFLPTLIPGKLHYTNLRNHRKILVVDGETGFTGGMNIRAGHLCEEGCKHPVRDTHFKIEGPVVAHLRETFASDWEFSSGEELNGETWFPPLAARGSVLARGISDGPDRDFDKIRSAILGALGCARDTVNIMTPYFLPEQPLITALNVAAMRGVAVNVVLPAQNNLLLVQWACMAQLWQMLQRGCRFWLAPPPFDHSKLMVVDGIWSFIGSANWDPRSLRLNFEFNVECYDHDLAMELESLMLEKRAGGQELTLEIVDGRPIWMRLRDGVCRLALPYL
jgi:cardiolipin synthase